MTRAPAVDRTFEGAKSYDRKYLGRMTYDRKLRIENPTIEERAIEIYLGSKTVGSNILRSKGTEGRNIPRIEFVTIEYIRIESYLRWKVHDLRGASVAEWSKASPRVRTVAGARD